MNETARRRRILACGCAVGLAGLVCFTGATASAQPAYPQPPTPGNVTQPVAVAPAALAPQAYQQAATPGVGQLPVAAAPTIVPATSQTMAEYFDDKKVTREAQVSHGFKALNIVLPMPPGWRQVPDPNVIDAFAVIADRTGANPMYASNAQVVIYKLGGEFDPKDAISHGFVDAQQLPAWQPTGASFADFGGFPSSIIEGTYRDNELTMNTSRRHVLATSGRDRYLVSLSVTTAVDQAVPTADATDAIVTGFRVSDPNAPAPTPGAATAVSPAAPVAQQTAPALQQSVPQ